MFEVYRRQKPAPVRNRASTRRGIADFELCWPPTYKRAFSNDDCPGGLAEAAYPCSVMNRPDLDNRRLTWLVCGTILAIALYFCCWYAGSVADAKW